VAAANRRIILPVCQSRRLFSLQRYLWPRFIPKFSVISDRGSAPDAHSVQQAYAMIFQRRTARLDKFRRNANVQDHSSEITVRMKKAAMKLCAPTSTGLPVRKPRGETMPRC